MNLAQKEKRLEELLSHHVLYRHDTLYNMTGVFKYNMAKKISKSGMIEESIALAILEFFDNSLDREAWVDYIMIMENFIDKKTLKEII